jgi:hypothetical protein
MSRFERAHHARVAHNRDLWQAFRGPGQPPDPVDVYPIAVAVEVSTMAVSSPGGDIWPELNQK